MNFIVLYAKDGFVASAHDLPTDQYGTPLDPPAHWDVSGATISDLPPTCAVRPWVVIDAVRLAWPLPIPS